ncbi:hypothetical protein SAMD00019534_070870 [Acytostelium subglobosum LB1]|uniref:hypothetical protein n=1 Tax=Acytostelium subglobosum LB1 TaxID=1410327 RepID=UPI0006448510|nr:hypothetical protein SAMD00019534_070870 [Acytostelium subglobosum LB1]GAM23912.1 hypothetical protein SAMD00019534_070870 [Acytostelium subglobosum LB1]|eukprot:XP_012752948.1 hypothetical protein SAMD00019534_070870 [Acytostelium subglobosum LB1]
MYQIILIYLICSPISIIGSGFIITTWGLFAKLKHSGSNFIFFQSISDLLFTLKYIMTVILYYAAPSIVQFDDSLQPSGSSAVCFMLGMYGQFWGQATVMWSFMMTVKVFISFFYTNNTESSESIKWYHLFVWGFCGMNAVIIAAFDQYGPSSNGCWIVRGNNPFRLFELIPLYITITVSICILVLILWKIKQKRPTLLMPNESVKYKIQEREFRNQLLKFILIFVIFWTPPTILRTMEYMGIEKSFFVYLDAVSVSSQALANSIVWGTSPQFFKLLRRKLRGGPEDEALIQ